MKNVVLIGFMGTGKSRVGHMAARKLGFKFVDTDDLIVQRLQMSVSDIFERLGEAKFRDIERQVVADVSAKEGQVIATGGGVPLNEENITNLKRNGLLICLAANPDIIYRRTLRSESRPLLQAKDRLEQIRSLLESRRFYYDVADFSVDTSSRPASAVAKEIVELYNNHVDSQS